MKKIFLISLITIVIYLSSTKVVDSHFIIPNEAIRLRVIPNSNSTSDQQLKTKVSKKLQVKMSNLLKETKNVDEARQIIKGNISHIDKEIGSLLKREQYADNYLVNFGYNFFPEKRYKGIIYPEGYYESVKVTMGKGLGDNWWCVLFPPLCLIEAEETTEVEYKFFVKEIIKKYFGI